MRYMELERRGATLILTCKRKLSTELVQFQFLGPLCNISNVIITIFNNQTIEISISSLKKFICLVYTTQDKDILAFSTKGRVCCWPSSIYLSLSWPV